MLLVVPLPLQNSMLMPSFLSLLLGSDALVKKTCGSYQNDTVQVLEDLLFKTAQSKEHYLDLSTLQSRMRVLTIRLLQRRLKQERQRRLSESP
jgi:hypothetical protein